MRIWNSTIRKHTKTKVQIRSQNQSQKLFTPNLPLDSKLEDASRDSL
jgi:hypothetical protein